MNRRTHQPEMDDDGGDFLHHAGGTGRQAGCFDDSRGVTVSPLKSITHPLLQSERLAPTLETTERPGDGAIYNHMGDTATRFHFDLCASREPSFTAALSMPDFFSHPVSSTSSTVHNLTEADLIAAQSIIDALLASQPLPIPDPARDDVEPLIDRESRNDRSGDIVVGVTTTLMIRNIPIRFTPASLRKVIDKEGFGDDFDFFYMPIDFRSRRSMGYAFVNFPVPDRALAFAACFENRRLRSSYSTKVVTVSAAARQGLVPNLSAFKASTLKQMHRDELRPIVRVGGQLTPLTEALFCRLTNPRSV